MKCLEKDRTRRYDTANGVAMDLKRHLNNETVLARRRAEAQTVPVRRRSSELTSAGWAAAARTVSLLRCRLRSIATPLAVS